jgi:hypothetical protein
VLEIFSDLFRFVIGLHIQASTITPTITPSTLPAIDPLSRPEFPVVVVVDELVTVAAVISSDQKGILSIRKPGGKIIPIAVVVTVAGADAPTNVSETEVTVAVAVVAVVVGAAGVADCPLH